ncbi:MAG: CDP-alcohol phosphatidyltransferase family protein [Woeseiaceae bacterium]|nr:CDP-alcohol phosphatidyltransferase family protein [Woeseiaceae bacterium]
MTIYDLKPAFTNLLRPVCQWLAGHGVTPNQLTVGATLLSIATGALIAFKHEHASVLLALPFVLFVRMGLNALDGMLAREHGQQSRLGGFLNELGDVVSDIVLYLPFALLPGVSGELVLLVVLLAVLSEMTGVVAIQAGAERRYDGPMGKSDRAFFFGALALAIGSGLEAGLWVQTLLAFVSLLLVATIVNRVSSALKQGSPAVTD